MFVSVVTSLVKDLLTIGNLRHRPANSPQVDSSGCSLNVKHFIHFGIESGTLVLVIEALSTHYVVSLDLRIIIVIKEDFISKNSRFMSERNLPNLNRAIDIKTDYIFFQGIYCSTFNILFNIVEAIY